MNTLLISDLHLDESRPAISRAFFDFLDREVNTTEALYILGDFFEVWLGDDEDSELAITLQKTLKTFSDGGCALYFMHGNRDFLVGEGFAQATGAQLIPDPTVIDLYGEAVLLMHGDSLCTNDHDYMAFREQARSAQWQQAVLAQPLAERRLLAAGIRHQSQSMNSLKAEDIMDVTSAEVDRVMTEHRVQTLIHGHTHRPATHTLERSGQEAQRIVLGDWDEHGWCIRASAKHRCQLEKFRI